MLFCPLHKLPILDSDRLPSDPIDSNACPRCRQLGIRIHTCELDKIGRVVDTIEQQGRTIDHGRCFVVIVERA